MEAFCTHWCMLNLLALKVFYFQFFFNLTFFVPPAYYSTLHNSTCTPYITSPCYWTLTETFPNLSNLTKTLLNMAKNLTFFVPPVYYSTLHNNTCTPYITSQCYWILVNNVWSTCSAPRPPRGPENPHLYCSPEVHESVIINGEIE